MSSSCRCSFSSSTKKTKNQTKSASVYLLVLYKIFCYQGPVSAGPVPTTSNAPPPFIISSLRIIWMLKSEQSKRNMRKRESTEIVLLFFSFSTSESLSWNERNNILRYTHGTLGALSGRQHLERDTTVVSTLLEKKYLLTVIESIKKNEKIKT